MRLERKLEIFQAIVFEINNEESIHPMHEDLARDPEENIEKGYKHWLVHRPNKKEVRKYIHEIKDRGFGLVSDR